MSDNIDEAKKALKEAFEENLKRMIANKVQSINQPKVLTTTISADGVIRYHIDSPEDVDRIYAEIEKEGYIILDEDDNGDWIEVISAKKMTTNIINEDLNNSLANEISKEIDKTILDKLVSMTDVVEKENKLRKDYEKYVKLCKQSPWSYSPENIASYEEWKKGN